jgi:transcriptional regulator with XRE-family HTH domain
MSDMENGYRHPSDKVLESIAQVLDSTFADLGRYNPKLPIEGLKRLAASNPLYVTALRKVIEKNVSPQDLLEFAEKYQAKKRD